MSIMQNIKCPECKQYVPVDERECWHCGAVVIDPTDQIIEQYEADERREEEQDYE
jgi:hypothetical protein